MMKTKITSELIQYTANPGWYTFRGGTMILVGIIIAILSLVSPNVYMLGENASWLPVIGFVVLLIGILRCIDGLVSETAQGYLFNMQGGILDIIVGFLVFFSSNSTDINNENLLIVAYLLLSHHERFRHQEDPSGKKWKPLSPITKTVWGILENHWNGTVLNSIETALEWARTMTRNKIPPWCIYHCL